MAPEVIDLGRFCSSHHYCPFRTAPLAGALHALTLMRVITVFDGLLVAQIEGRDGTGHKAVPDMVGGKCRAGGRAPRPPALGHRRAMPTLPTDPAATATAMSSARKDLQHLGSPPTIPTAWSPQ